MRSATSADSDRLPSAAGMLLAVLSLCASILTMFDSTAHASVDAPRRSGDLLVVDQDDPSKEVSHGGSATKFSLRLSDDATCPGDSANDQWRVQSYLIPATDDPSAVHYGEQGPDGDGQWPLYDVATHPFTHVLTLANSQLGLPGRIDSMPVFSFVLFPPGTLSPGRYRLGIACTYFRETATYWDTELVFATSPNDDPGQLTWRLADAPATLDTSSGPDSSVLLWTVLGAGILGAAAITFILWQRSARRTTPLLKEQS